jgi:hypothetical protein
LSGHANLVYTITKSNYETDLEEKVKIVAEKDIEYQNIKSKLTKKQVEDEKSDFRLSKNGLLMYKNRLYVPEVEEIKLLILNELHKKPYS